MTNNKKTPATKQGPSSHRCYSKPQTTIDKCDSVRLLIRPQTSRQYNKTTRNITDSFPIKLWNNKSSSSTNCVTITPSQSSFKMVFGKRLRIAEYNTTPRINTSLKPQNTRKVIKNRHDDTWRSSQNKSKNGINHKETHFQKQKWKHRGINPTDNSNSNSNKNVNVNNPNQDSSHYPMINVKKYIQNILPKSDSFLQNNDTEELLSKALNPWLKHQKKINWKQINSLNQEIGVNYSENFSLVDKNKFDDKFQIAQDYVDMEKDNQLIEMISKLINKNFKLGTEINTALESKRKNEEYERKKLVLLRFKRIWINAAIHFKRLKWKIQDFYEIGITNIKPFEDKESYLLICAIKDKDVNTVFDMIKNNSFLVHDFDHFHQTPWHWAAKRNWYQMMSYMISNGANCAAKDWTGRTPLHVAAMMNNIEAVQILWYELANPWMKDNNGFIPFDFAKSKVMRYIWHRAGSLHKIQEMRNVKEFVKRIKNGLNWLFWEEWKTNFHEVKQYIFEN